MGSSRACSCGSPPEDCGDRLQQKPRLLNRDHNEPKGFNVDLIRIDPLEIKTHSRLRGVRSLLDAFQQALPELEKREREALEQQAENKGWEYDYYNAARQSLDETFKYWLPRFAAYSVIVLLYAALESQLYACADRVQKRSHSPFEPFDIKGKGIEPADLYLKKLKAFEVKQDDEWNTLRDLRDLRNIVAHRMGSKGHPERHRKEIKHLSREYPGDLKFSDDFLNDEMYISISLCRRFTDAVERFLNRVLAAVNAYPVEPESSPSEK